jgi:hypothetical protein
VNGVDCGGRWLAVAALVVLTGCATPRPVLDLAGQGAATVGLAEVSLREYLALTKAQLEARMDLLRFDAQQEARDRARREFDAFLERRSGPAATDDATDLIRILGDEHRRIREKEALEIATIARTTVLDAAAVAPVPTEKLTEAKKSFGVLAQELTAQEWVALAAGYAREIRAGVEALRAADKKAPSGKE